MPRLPSLSIRELAKLLEKGGAIPARQGSTDHAIYCRHVEGRRYSAPVQMVDPAYCKRVLRQLKFTDQEIEGLLK